MLAPIAIRFEPRAPRGLDKQRAVDGEVFVGHQGFTRGRPRTAAMNPAAMSQSTSLAGFFVNTVTSQIGASIDMPTNNRDIRLHVSCSIT